jgi:hypothetical protein
MNQFGAAARCPFGKISLLNQQSAVSPGCSIHRYSQTGCSAADDEEFPRLISVFDSVEYFIAFHRVLPSFCEPSMVWTGYGGNNKQSVRDRPG